MKGNPLWDKKFKNIYANSRAEADLARTNSPWYNNGGKGGRGESAQSRFKSLPALLSLVSVCIGSTRTREFTQPKSPYRETNGNPKSDNAFNTCI